MFMLPLFALLQRIAEPTPFLLPPEISSFWGTSIAITPFGTQSDPREKEVFHWAISSEFLPSMTLPYPLFSIAPLLTYPLLPLLLPFLLLGGALGPGF